MSWGQLLSISRDIKQERLNQVVTSCPNDGEPLRTGPDGIRFCPFDGWNDADRR